MLADTSVWVDYLKLGSRGTAWPLDSLLERREVAVCGPVAAEIYVGMPSRRRAEMWRLLNGLEWLELDRAGWGLLATVAAALRDRGTPVAMTDLQIAAIAVAAGAQLWSRDADFDQIAPLMPALLRFQPA